MVDVDLANAAAENRSAIRCLPSPFTGRCPSSVSKPGDWAVGAPAAYSRGDATQAYCIHTPSQKKPQLSNPMVTASGLAMLMPFIERIS